MTKKYFQNLCAELCAEQKRLSEIEFECFLNRMLTTILEEKKMLPYGDMIEYPYHFTSEEVGRIDPQEVISNYQLEVNIEIKTSHLIITFKYNRDVEEKEILVKAIRAVMPRIGFTKEENQILLFDKYIMKF